MGGKFKAMTLISEAELARLRDRQLTEYNPSVRSMTKLQALIDKVFEDKNLTAEEKQKILNTLHERFSQLYSKYKNIGTPTPSIADVPPASGANTNESLIPESDPSFISASDEQIPDNNDGDITEEETSFGFPKIDLAEKFKRKLGLFIDFLKENKNSIACTSKNELVIDGKIFPNSSFSDLVRNMYVKGHKLNLSGSEEFLTKLASLEVDANIFSNSDNIMMLQDPVFNPKYQSGKGKKRTPLKSDSSVPPGKLPRILRLFRV